MPERGRLVRPVLPIEEAYRKEANPFGSPFIGLAEQPGIRPWVRPGQIVALPLP